MFGVKRLVLAVAITLLSAVAGAGSKPVVPLVLAFSPLPPWKVIDAAGAPSGPYLQIMQQLARRLSTPLQVRTCPLLRCLELLRRGEADFGIGVAPGPGRDEVLDFLQPAFAAGSAIGFYRRSGDRTAVEAYSDLSALRIGATRGARYFPRFDQDVRLQKDYAPDKLSNLRKLLAGRIDVAIMLCGEADILLASPEFHRKIQLAGPVIGTGPRYVVLSRTSRAYPEKLRIEASLRQMVMSGEIARLLRPVEH